MLLGVFSDSHLGFSSGEKDDRFEESFTRFKESLAIFKRLNVDFILHAGDLFDEAVPSQEVWLKTFDSFCSNNGSVSELKKHELSGNSTVVVKGTPIIAIHGTHEFRGKDFANALDVLEKSNCLVHLHAGFVELQKNNEKVFVHGLGGVPEKMAKQVLEKYSPLAVHGCCNILLMHQSFSEFLPFDDESIASLSLSNLPNGFDLIVDGHLHWSDEQKLGEKRFLLTGSAIFTQMKKLEAQKEKGVFVFDTQSKQLNFFPFANQRKLFYQKFSFKDVAPEVVTKQVHEYVSSLPLSSNSFKPLVRLKISGTLAKGFSQSDLSFFLPQDKAIFSVSKEFSQVEFQKKIADLKELQNQKKSILEVGISLLEKNVSEAKLNNFDSRRMFDLLSIGENEKAESVLLSEQN